MGKTTGNVVLSPTDVYDMFEKIMNIKVEYLGEGNIKWRVLLYVKNRIGDNGEVWDNSLREQSVTLSAADVGDIYRFIDDIPTYIIHCGGFG